MDNSQVFHASAAAAAASVILCINILMDFMSSARYLIDNPAQIHHVNVRSGIHIYYKGDLSCLIACIKDDYNNMSKIR